MKTNFEIAAEQKKRQKSFEEFRKAFELQLLQETGIKHAIIRKDSFISKIKKLFYPIVIDKFYSKKERLEELVDKYQNMGYEILSK